MVEEMYMEEMKEQEKQSSNLATGHQDTTTNQNPNPKPHPGLDQKPPPGRHLIPNSDSLSSVVNGGHSRDQGENATMKSARHHDIAANFGMEDWDFPSYNNGGHNLGSGVSLTLGLQQHNGGGMSLSFAPPPEQSTLLFARDHIDDNQPVHFSMLDGEAQALPYRDLMGAQLLHDMAG